MTMTTLILLPLQLLLLSFHIVQFTEAIYAGFGRNSPALLDAKCRQNEQCHLMIPNSICALPAGICICALGEMLDGGRCLSLTSIAVKDDDQVHGTVSNDDPSNGKDHLMAECNLASQNERPAECEENTKFDEFCKFSEEQCTVDGSSTAQQNQCIANLCQIPPDCPPGFVAIGPECHPFAVTGGDCIHPTQCLGGSICVRGKCRGPCAENQVFIEDTCVDYEGGGCIARACIEHSCPQAFASCNYVPQRDEYLCCERQIRPTAQCPEPSSVPQISRVTNDVIACLHQPCGPGFSCQFASIHGQNSYICCSIPIRRLTTSPVNNKGKRKKQVEKEVQRGNANSKQRKKKQRRNRRINLLSIL